MPKTSLTRHHRLVTLLNIGPTALFPIRFCFLFGSAPCSEAHMVSEPFEEFRCSGCGAVAVVVISL